MGGSIPDDRKQNISGCIWLAQMSEMPWTADTLALIRNDIILFCLFWRTDDRKIYAQSKKPYGRTIYAQSKKPLQMCQVLARISRNNYTGGEQWVYMIFNDIREEK
jgi:hypothetical protein